MKSIGSSGFAAKFDFARALVDSEGGTGGRNMLLDERPLDGDLVGPDIDGADDGRNDGAQYNGRHHYDQRACASGPWRAAPAEITQPAISHPLQRQDDVLIDVVDADHEAAVLFEQQAVAAEEKANRHGEQKHGAQSTQEVAVERARQAQLADVDFLDVPPIANPAGEFPTSLGDPIDQARPGPRCRATGPAGRNRTEF